MAEEKEFITQEDVQEEEEEFPVETEDIIIDASEELVETGDDDQNKKKIKKIKGSNVKEEPVLEQVCTRE